MMTEEKARDVEQDLLTNEELQQEYMRKLDRWSERVKMWNDKHGFSVRPPMWDDGKEVFWANRKTRRAQKRR